MNFNIYINDQLYQELEHCKLSLNKSRNSIVTEALIEWINHHKQSSWPKNFFKFNEIKNNTYPDITELRTGLLDPKEPNF